MNMNVEAKSKRRIDEKIVYLGKNWALTHKHTQNRTRKEMKKK